MNYLNYDKQLIKHCWLFKRRKLLRSCKSILVKSSKLIIPLSCSSSLFQVKRFSYTTSTEDSTSSPQTWSMERKCTSKCEPGCIVIGERTKLSACTTCCEQSYCNVGTGAANDLTIKGIDLFLALILQITLTIIMYPSWHCKQNNVPSSV